MSEAKKKCRYKSVYTRWECPYEALDDSKDGFCIFHDRRPNKDIEKFNEGIKRILEEKESDAYRFKGFFFPTFFDFSGFEFKKNVSFSQAVFAGGVNFSKAKFLGDLSDFSEAKFSGALNDFKEVKFLGKKTIFNLAEFSGETPFKNADFLGVEVDFKGIEFSKDIESISFGGTIFEAKTNFTWVDLRNFFFFLVDLKNVDFSLLDWDWKYKLQNEISIPRYTKLKEVFYKETSEIYRQLKVQFHNKRDFAKAGMFHFREQECKRKACKLLSWQIFNRAFLRFLKWSCGYGEKLSKVVLSSFEIVLAFAIFYMSLGLHKTDQNESLLFQYSLNAFSTTFLGTILKDFWTSLIFSIKGFFPLWRFQQYKVVGDVANLVAGIEFLLGAFMVGLFVYVFRRRMDK
jgi:uncharacterized protein YjbI with pentapeptide repeats